MRLPTKRVQHTAKSTRSWRFKHRGENVKENEDMDGKPEEVKRLKEIRY